MSIYPAHPLIGLAAILVLISGCQSVPDRYKTDMQTIDESFSVWAGPDKDADAANEVRGSAMVQEPPAEEGLVPPEVSNALLPPLNVELSGSQAISLEARFDLVVEKSPIRAVYLSLVKDTPHNMVVHPSVQGEVTLSLKNVNINDVMQTLRNVYGYEYKYTNTGYEVLPSKIKSQIFHINYLNVRRSGKSQIKVSSGQLTDAGQAPGGSDKNGAQKKGDGTSSRVDTYSNSDFWKELESALTAIIGEEGGRKVIVNPQSGIIVVRATPRELRGVADYLQATDNIVKRQVIIEAKILEVELSDSFQTGINWSGLIDKGNNSLLVSQTGGGTVFGSSGVAGTAGNSGILDPSATSMVSGSDTTAFGGVFSLAMKFNNFTAFIEMLKKQGDVHVLSSPRVSTINNQKAVIKVGFDEFFVTDITANTTDSATGSTQSLDLELTPFFSGVALDVIPQIDENGTVTLHVHPSVSKVTEKIKEISISSKEGIKLPLAVSAIRESDSIIRVKSGQVVVIGGLMQDVLNSEIAEVPLLSSIPFLGNFFRHKKSSVRKSELVILLRPVVVEDGKTWANYVTNSRRSVERLTIWEYPNNNTTNTTRHDGMASVNGDAVLVGN